MSGIRLPEVHIPLPQPVVYCLEQTQWIIESAYHGLQNAFGRLSVSPELLDHLKANAFLLFGVSIIFWPLLLSLITTFTVMGAWTFWLFTTAIFGILQLVYVVYQFVMIAVDILGLSLLKTYTMVRNRVLNYLGRGNFAFWSNPSRSRRLAWRERLEEANSYEDFLKIQIEPHEPVLTKQERRKSDPAIMMTRSSSYGEMEGLVESPKRMSRNRSYTSLMTTNSEETEPRFHPEPQVEQDLGEMCAVMLMTTKQRLKEARQTAVNHEDDLDGGSNLKQLLQGVVKRNHLNVDNHLTQNARTVASAGQYGLSAQSRRLISSYFEEIEKGLDWIADSRIPENSASKTSSFNDSIVEGEEAGTENALIGDGSIIFTKMRNRTSELNDRMTLIRKIRANVGRTSLMLSGGGAQAMYHLGVIRALIESGTYQDIKVISGTSGGSISAAMCALKTPEELLRDVCVPHVSTDYGLTGQQQKENIRWFPSVRIGNQDDFLCFVEVCSCTV